MERPKIGTTEGASRWIGEEVDQQAASLLIVQDLNIRIINAATGELLRELTLNPDRDYQPTGRPPGPQRKTP